MRELLDDLSARAERRLEARPMDFLGGVLAGMLFIVFIWLFVATR